MLDWLAPYSVVTLVPDQRVRRHRRTALPPSSGDAGGQTPAQEVGLLVNGRRRLQDGDAPNVYVSQSSEPNG